ncbi:MAG TPA: DegT/DnrJ/EryC1/StrS family aminotransferase [Baekduia sp.]|uniref:DegT/DnrJ/EryC1/StrS family aminotransferase n=1 Tax=Baekduia sp. TaxID=2600305 RepID=UPI002D786CCD|nr:DegT/DnrJ/EryC1/StrS family aminotransferase [Baekduia sp.]HET6507835.1 DegT/DnrJ/EryC1/StrS family aminotransferase [Baekduia sp.]
MPDIVGTRSDATRLALLGGAPVGAPERPAFPRITDRARRRVDAALADGAMPEVANRLVGLSNAHPAIGEAEAAIAAWHGVDRCLTTSTGEASLHACLIGLEITGGAEVITTPYTYGCSTSPILHNDAVPVFVDVDPVTGLLDPAAVEAAIGPRTEAILVTHIYGQPADMTALRAIADRHGLALVEDGSQAHGARHRGTRVGAFGDAAGFSCMGGKLLATTEAGYMVTRRDDVYWKTVISCQHAGNAEVPGRAAEAGFPSDLNPFVDSLIYSYRINVLSAILLTEQLAKLDEENANRTRNRDALVGMLADVPSISAPVYPDDDEPVYHIVSLNFEPEHAGISKATYLKALAAEGAPVFSYVETPLHRLERLRPQTRAPRVMWTDRITRAGIDYSALELPGCDHKVERSIEMSWNWIDDDPAAMRRLADCFEKVDAQLPALREHEQRHGHGALSAG